MNIQHNLGCGSLNAFHVRIPVFNNSKPFYEQPPAPILLTQIEVVTNVRSKQKECNQLIVILNQWINLPINWHGPNSTQ